MLLTLKQFCPFSIYVFSCTYLSFRTSTPLFHASVISLSYSTETERFNNYNSAIPEILLTYGQFHQKEKALPTCPVTDEDLGQKDTLPVSTSSYKRATSVKSQANVPKKRQALCDWNQERCKPANAISTTKTWPLEWEVHTYGQVYRERAKKMRIYRAFTVCRKEPWFIEHKVHAHYAI